MAPQNDYTISDAKTEIAVMGNRIETVEKEFDEQKSINSKLLDYMSSQKGERKALMFMGSVLTLVILATSIAKMFQ